MLIEFSVGNFRSFEEPVTFSMVAANITAQKKSLNHDNVIQAEGNKLLKSAAIYGANASGKSNLLKAFSFMRRFVLSSTDSNSEEPVDIEPFLLNTENLDQPSYFEAIFLIGEIRYRYGFEVTSEAVHTEWLFRTKSRESELFWREDGKFEVRAGFKEGRGLEKRTRNNALFLSVVDQWNGEIANSIIKWFRQVNMISGLEDKRYLGFIINQYLENHQLQNQIQSYMQKMDLGITGISAERVQGMPEELKEILSVSGDDEIPNELTKILSDESRWFTPAIRLEHQQFDSKKNKVGTVEFSFEEQESEGTKKAFALSGPILHSLIEGQVLFIDELDARLHPLMTKYIIGLFNSRITNPQNAQLIFVTHDTNLLSKDIFRRDQIWFTEKNRFGSTDLYSLVEYKVRNDASFETDYISGKYGAIPYLGAMPILIDNHNGQA